MADQFLNELAAADSPLLATDLVPVVRGTANLKRSTIGAIIALLLDTVNIYTKAQRGTVLPIAYSATITLNLQNANSFSIGVLTGNLTLANPTNLPAAGQSQSGSIFFRQDGTGSRIITFGNNFKWAGGVVGILSTAANARDRLDYVVDHEGLIHASLAKAIA